MIKYCIVLLQWPVVILLLRIISFFSGLIKMTSYRVTGSLLFLGFNHRIDTINLISCFSTNIRSLIWSRYHFKMSINELYWNVDNKIYLYFSPCEFIVARLINLFNKQTVMLRCFGSFCVLNYWHCITDLNLLFQK